MHLNYGDYSAIRRLMAGWRKYIVRYELGSDVAIITWRSKRRCLEHSLYIGEFLGVMGFNNVIHKTPKRGIIAECRQLYGYMVRRTDVQSVAVRFAA
jgi:hypothetical protein